jgi:hypothetical protein
MTTRTIQDYDLVEPGTYDATSLGIEDGDDGQFGHTIEFGFSAMTEDGPVEIYALASDKWKGATKARAWFSVLVGHALAKDDVIDWDDVKGRPCQIVVTHVVDKKGITRARVMDVQPPRKARPVPADSAEPAELPF